MAAGTGFGTHPHDNMEIISIPLEGDLEHKDSMGNLAVIKQGDVQVMSAGSGITHSEHNKNRNKPVKFLQICVIAFGIQADDELLEEPFQTREITERARKSISEIAEKI